MFWRRDGKFITLQQITTGMSCTATATAIAALAGAASPVSDRTAQGGTEVRAEA